MSSPVHTRTHLATLAALFFVFASLAVVAFCAPVAAAAGWEVQRSGIDQYMDTVSALSPTEAWVQASSSDDLFHTTDGGANWYEADNTSLTGDYETSFFLNASDGWVVSYDYSAKSGYVAYTTDGGGSWGKTAVDAQPDAIDFADASNGWLCGMNPRSKILHSSDGGQSWTPQTFTADTNASASALAAVSPTTCWAITGDKAFLTTDSGSSWPETALDVPSGQFIDDIAATDPDHAWVVGGTNSSGLIMATSDGGADWTTQSCFSTGYIHAVAFLSDNEHGWAVGGDGLVLATTDGGATWLHQATGSTAILEDVGFVDADNGWAVGTDGTIIHTSDGGGTPDTTPPVTTANLADGAWMSAWSNTVQLTATDTGVGVWKIQYKVDDAADWTSSWSPTTVTVPTTTQGAHTVQYWAMDKGGNTEAAKTLHVNVDTVAPTVSGPKKLMVKKGKSVTVKFRITDKVPCGATGGAEIEIYKAKSSGPSMPLKDYDLNNKRVNAPLSYTFKCTLKKGKYEVWIGGRDAAGNWCAKDAVTKLTVK